MTQPDLVVGAKVRDVWHKDDEVGTIISIKPDMVRVKFPSEVVKYKTEFVLKALTLQGEK